MDQPKEFNLANPPLLPEEEDQATLAAIEEGMEDARAGRVVSAEEVRNRLPQWITASSTPKGR